MRKKIIGSGLVFFTLIFGIIIAIYIWITSKQSNDSVVYAEWVDHL